MTCNKHSCFDCYCSRYVTQLLHKLLQYLECKVEIALQEAWDILNEYLQQKFGGRWREILKKAFEVGVEAALSALEAIKDEIIRVCKENHRLLEQLTKLATKSLTAAASTVATQVAANVIAKKATEQTVKQTSKASLKLSMGWSSKFSIGLTAKKTSKMAVGQIAKSVTRYATPVGVVADLAQAGLEYAGHKEAGKAVGITGNIAAGVFMGAPLGPPGLALGALGGFAIWGVGEVVGGFVDRAFGDQKERCHNHDHEDEEHADDEEEQHREPAAADNEE